MTYPTTRTGITCLVPAPRRVASWFLPFEPFQITLWLCIVGCLALESIGLLFTHKIGEVSKEHSWSNSFKFGCISTLKLFISQGTNYLVTSSAVRLILFSCYMVDIIISSIYSGGLASILTIPSLEEAADTIDRVIKYKLIWAGITPDWNFTLQNTEDVRMRKMVDLFRVYSAEELGRKSLTEHIGVIFERLQFGHLALPSYIEQTALNRMKMMMEDIFYEYCVAYTIQTWSLLQKFNNLSLMIQSSGLMKYWELKAVAKYFEAKVQKQIMSSVHPNFDDIGPTELGLENFAGIIVLWIGGSILSTLAFFGEMFLHKWTQTNGFFSRNSKIDRNL